jgi:hypothetical protein
MICQAYYVDSKYPTLSLDEQVEKTKDVEERVFGWNIVSSTLEKVLNKTVGEVRAAFKPLWDDLNRYAHPSVRQMDLVAQKDFAALVTDSFNETLAWELLGVTDKVFDIAYAVVLIRFPKVVTLVRQYEFINEWEECLPNTIGIVKQSSQ